MTDVNPELNPNPLLPGQRRKAADQAKVTNLFGSAPDVILEAVGRFLQKNPGSLDHHNLRVIAVAAPHIDPKIVAEMIEQLPITRMHVGARPVDVGDSSPRLGRVLAPYRHRVRQNLINDLIEQSTLELLKFSPPERLTGQARAIVQDHLLDLARIPAKQQEALGSPLATPETVKAVLDTIEARIERSERGTTVRPPGPLPLSLVVDGLKAVFDHQTLCTSHGDLDRAWRLVRRCQPDDESLRTILWSVAGSSKLTEDTANSVLDAIDRVDARGEAHSDRVQARYMRGRMAAVPAMPEAIARRAIQKAAAIGENRASERRWFMLRNHHYSRSDALLECISPDHIDEALFDAMPPHTITDEVLAQMTNGEILGSLLRTATDRATIEAVVKNPHLVIDLTEQELVAFLERYKAAGPSRHAQKNIERIASNIQLSDEALLRTIERTDDEIQRKGLIAGAICNSSADHKLLDHVIGLRDKFLIFDLASRTHKPDLHRRLADIALGRRLDSTGMEWLPKGRLKDALFHNGTIGADVIDELIEATRDRPDLADRTGNSDPSNAHDEIWRQIGLGFTISNRPEQNFVAIARLIADGHVPRERIEPFIRTVADQHSALGPITHEAISLLVESNSLDEGHWATLTGDDDAHIALRYATHPSCRSSLSRLQTPAVKRIAGTAEAIEKGVALPPEVGLKRWSQLPDSSEAPFDLPPEAALIDGQVVDGSKVEVVRTSKKLTATADVMGNCLAGYEDGVRDGRYIIATTRDGDDLTAISWTRDSAHRWRIDQVNGRFNRDNVPPSLRLALDTMTDQLRAGELLPVESSEPAVVDRAEATAPDKSDSVRVVRRSRRAPLILGGGAEQEGVTPTNSPSLLGYQSQSHDSEHETSTIEKATETVSTDAVPSTNDTADNSLTF